jgi:hypothetical protein
MEEDLYVEVFPPFLDLPDFTFTGFETVLCDNEDLLVSYQRVGHYIVYLLVYKMLPEDHPEALNYIAYDIDALEQEERKVYKIYNRYMDELTLGEATYDIGLLFSGGRVLSDTHFIEMGYK